MAAPPPQPPQPPLVTFRRQIDSATAPPHGKPRLATELRVRTARTRGGGINPAVPPLVGTPVFQYHVWGFFRTPQAGGHYPPYPGAAVRRQKVVLWCAEKTRGPSYRRGGAGVPALNRNLRWECNGGPSRHEHRIMHPNEHNGNQTYDVREFTENGPVHGARNAAACTAMVGTIVPPPPPGGGAAANGPPAVQPGILPQAQRELNNSLAEVQTIMAGAPGGAQFLPNTLCVRSPTLGLPRVGAVADWYAWASVQASWAPAQGLASAPVARLKLWAAFVCSNITDEGYWRTIFLDEWNVETFVEP